MRTMLPAKIAASASRKSTKSPWAAAFIGQPSASGLSPPPSQHDPDHQDQDRQQADGQEQARDRQVDGELGAPPEPPVAPALRATRRRRKPVPQVAARAAIR